MATTSPRIVLAKVGLDGHDRGIKVVARGLRDAGMHVIYAGLWQLPEAVVRTVADEDAGWLGLSLLSGAHMTLVPRVLELVRKEGLENVGVLVGGIIPDSDVAKLLEMGVAHVFGPGTSMEEIVQFIRAGKPRPGATDRLVEGVKSKNRLALSRLLTMVSQGDHVAEILGKFPAPPKPSRVIAVTGSGGVGKSTLIGKLIETLRAAGSSVAVLACDPQSPITGGALLGDRFRMPNRPDDPGVFIRSLVAPSGHSALAENLDSLVRILECFGFDNIFIETAGAGQGDTAVRNLADAVVLLLQPETGDDLQWEKAGILEIADVVLIHKADMPGADRVAAQVRTALDLGPTQSIPVISVSSKTGAGLPELTQVLQKFSLRRTGLPTMDPRGKQGQNS